MISINTPAEHDGPTLLFDGVCNLCEDSVRFVIKRDPKRRFRFASLQSDYAQPLLKQYGLEDQPLSSVILINNGRAWRKSAAALRVAGMLSGPVKLLEIFLILPRPLTDWAYDFIGNRRYRWFGKKQACWIPEPELMALFLDTTHNHVDPDKQDHSV